ncbi:hypothetical protein JXM67_05450 [candidate division WOR-3 bacterium]|nr:hypothetical protein [candidate division WOR-3 bacterium]
MINTFLLSVSTIFAGLTLGMGSSAEPYVGYRLGVFEPYFSLGFLNTSGSYTSYYYTFNDNLPEGYKEEVEVDTLSWKVCFINPSLGTRIVFGSGFAKPYLRVSAGTPIPLYLKIEDDDDTDQEQLDSLKARMFENPEPLITVKSGLGFEVSLLDRISISGEMNYSYMFGSALVSSHERESEDGSYREENESHVDFNLGRTGGELWLNLYF